MGKTFNSDWGLVLRGPVASMGTVNFDCTVVNFVISPTPPDEEPIGQNSKTTSSVRTVLKNP